MNFLFLKKNCLRNLMLSFLWNYNIILSLLKHFSLTLEHRKSKMFYFFRLHGLFNLLSLNFSHLGKPVLYSKDNWRYLGFIFDNKLLFWQYIKFYSNKALSIVKYMKMLGNSTRELLSHSKRLPYRIYVLSIMLYRFLLWYFNKTPLLYLLKEFRKIQQRVALWILDTFHTSSSLGIETITSLISIHLYFQKLSGRHQLRTLTLLLNYAIKFLFESRHIINSHPYYLSLENICFKQWLKIKSSTVDSNNHLNGIFSSFDSLNYKFSPGSRLIDIFPSHFPSHQVNWKNKESKVVHNCKLNDIFTEAFLNPKSTIIVSNANIKNNITMSIHSYSNPIKKTLHYAINITTTEAVLFTIRCRIN